jgi:hypothetical protein
MAAGALLRSLLSVSTGSEREIAGVPVESLIFALPALLILAGFSLGLL